MQLRVPIVRPRVRPALNMLPPRQFYPACFREEIKRFIYRYSLQKRNTSQHKTARRDGVQPLPSVSMPKLKLERFPTISFPRCWATAL